MVKITDSQVEIGEKDNTCVLTMTEWEILKEKILNQRAIKQVAPPFIVLRLFRGLVNSDPLFFCQRDFMLQTSRLFPSQEKVGGNSYGDINRNKPD